MTKLGVIAGTPIDTQMGVDFLKKAGYDTVSRHCSETPEQQNNMQVLHKTELDELVVSLCTQMADEGAHGIFMYCNSLAGAINLPYVHSHLSIPIVTPLDIYSGIPQKYRKIAVIAANTQALYAIETVIKNVDADCEVYGCGILPLVKLIESGISPDEVMERSGMAQMVESLYKMGGEALLLGCTHFPYIKKQLQAVSKLPVIDPAEDMLEMLITV